MKNATFLLVLLATYPSFAQQSPNSIFNYAKSIDDFASPNSTKITLNMDAFELKELKQNAYSISEALRESYNRRATPSDNMPIFAPEGKFFLEIYKVDEDIDHKLKIFQFEESKYSKRSMI